MWYQLCFGTIANRELLILLLLLPSNYTVHCLIEIHSKKTKHILLCLHPQAQRQHEPTVAQHVPENLCF